MFDITRGVLDRRRPLVIRLLKTNWNRVTSEHRDKINPKVMSYARGIAKATGLDLEQVLRSKPVINYRNRIWFRE